MEFIKNYFNELRNTIGNISIEDIKKVVNILYGAYKKDKHVFVIGNGGSASTASHFACDLSKGTVKDAYDENEKRFRVISMTDNVATLTALGNDLSYDEIFSQQLKNLVNPGDVVIAITASGNSQNILNAIATAKKLKAVTIGFVGFNGGKLKAKADYHIHTRSNHYGRIEDTHLILTHLISAYMNEIKKGCKDI